MGALPKTAESDPKLFEYLERMKSDPAFFRSSAVQQGKEMNVTRDTIARWRKMPIAPGASETVYAVAKAEMTKLLKEKAVDVDLAIYDRAVRTGDAACAELYFARTGWTKKTALEVTRGEEREFTPEAVFQALKDSAGMITDAQRLELIEFLQAWPKHLGSSPSVPMSLVDGELISVPALDQGRNENISREFHGEGNTSPTENHA